MTRKEQVGERIKTMRMSRGMTQLDLAHALHLGQSTIAIYETGQRMPDMEIIDYMADIFNVPAYSIAYSEDEVESAFKQADNALKDVGDEWGSRGREFKSLHPDHKKP